MVEIFQQILLLKVVAQVTGLGVIGAGILPVKLVVGGGEKGVE
jgi:hypothetical protein